MFVGWVHAERVKALLARGDVDRAEQEAHSAIAATQAQHSRYDEVRGNIALAHTLLRRADAAALARAEQALLRAQEEVATARRLYAEMGATARARIAGEVAR
jgi:hypothetical protein